MSRGRILGALMALVCATLVLAGCGSGSANSTNTGTATAPNTIVIKNFAFDPAALTVSPGATVTVKNQDTATHTVTATDKSLFDTGNVASGKTATFVAPSKPGTYTYICSVHNYMQGTLIVK